MRYYNFTLNTNSEQIEAGAKNKNIRLRDYSYENPISAINNFIYQYMKNGFGFLAYREEMNLVYS